MNQLRKRRNVRLLALFMLVLVAFTAGGCQKVFRSQGSISRDDIDLLLALHDHEQMMAWVKELTSDAYGGREAGTKYEDLAGDYIVDLLQSFGLEPWHDAGLTDYRQSFNFPGGQEPAENIIALLPGKSSEHYLLVGAHYDHIGIINGIIHPGADDNAVGTAAVLEVARIFSQSKLTPEYSVVFVLFGAEEKGLFGSQELVKHLREQKLDQKVVLLNLDVIAGVSGDTLVVYDSGYKGNKTWAKQAKAEAAASGVQASIEGWLPGGVDSISFTMHKIPAISLVWGDLLEEHPHLHQPTDTFENLNADIVLAATKAVIRVAWAFAN